MLTRRDLARSLSIACVAISALLPRVAIADIGICNISSDPNYNTTIVNELLCLKKDPILNGMIKALNSNPRVIGICDNVAVLDPIHDQEFIVPLVDTILDFLGQPVPLGEVQVLTSPPGGCVQNPNAEGCLEIADKNCDEGTHFNPTATLAHELWHAFERTTLGSEDDSPDPCSKIAKKEVDGVIAENRARLLDCAKPDRHNMEDPEIRHSYGCRPLCQCGDGIKTGTEECDPGGVSGNAPTGVDEELCPGQCGEPGTPTECLCRCGNGRIDGSDEICDPGNPAALDVPPHVEACQGADCYPLGDPQQCTCMPLPPGCAGAQPSSTKSPLCERSDQPGVDAYDLCGAGQACVAGTGQDGECGCIPSAHIRPQTGNEVPLCAGSYGHATLYNAGGIYNLILDIQGGPPNVLLDFSDLGPNPEWYPRDCGGDSTGCAFQYCQRYYVLSPQLDGAGNFFHTYSIAGLDAPLTDYASDVGRCFRPSLKLGCNHSGCYNDIMAVKWPGIYGDTFCPEAECSGRLCRPQTTPTPTISPTPTVTPTPTTTETPQATDTSTPDLPPDTPTPTASDTTTPSGDTPTPSDTPSPTDSPTP